MASTAPALQDAADGFPFGATYAPFWRSQPPPRAEWADDLRHMADLGFTAVNVFAAWHRIEKEEGRFDFDELDHVVACAAKAGLSVSIKVAVFRSFSLYPPRWLMRAYRGEGIRDRDGKCQVGGLCRLPCIDDPLYQRQARRYFEALVRHFADSGVMRHWMIWGEATFPGGCFCRHTVGRFRAWLRERYGSVEALNAAWNTESPSDYVSWSEIEPPLTQGHYGGYVPYLDWQQFLDANLTAHVAWLHGLVRALDRRHPTLVETWLGSENESGGGKDEWRLAGAADQLGLSTFDQLPEARATSMERLRSIAESRGKEAWAVELQGGPVMFSWFSGTPSARQIALLAWQMVARGAKGVFYWTYRPRMSDAEGGEFGMVRRDGSLTERARRVGEVSRTLQRHARLFRTARQQAQVAIFSSRMGEHLAKIDNKDLPQKPFYSTAIAAAHLMMLKRHVPADGIDPAAIAGGRLARYKVLLMPFSHCLSRETAEHIKAFVAAGGMVIADFPCALKDERGVCYSTLPGAGLDDLFGAVEEDAARTEEVRIRMRRGAWAGASAVFPAITARHFRQDLALRGARPLGVWPDGRPAITLRHYGKGVAILAGSSLFGFSALREGNRPPKLDDDRMRFLQAALARAGVEPPLALAGPNGGPAADLETSVLVAGTERVVIVINHGRQPVGQRLLLRGAAGRMTDLETGKPVRARAVADGLAWPAQIPGESCRVYGIR